ncbi:MAG: UvrB/UvrC motif-containing protein [Prevotella sp.]|jgi:hypothetical protein
MARIKLFLQQATEVMGEEKEGLLILTDSFQERQIAVPCSSKMFDEFKSRMNNPKHQTELSDILFNVIKWQTELSLELVIINVDNGHYSAILSNTDSLEQVPIDGAQAVLLNYISKDKIPLFIEEKLFLKQSSVYDMKAKGVSLPVNTLSSSMLRKAMEKAIEAENYELASQLRDELNRRQTNTHENNATEESSK